MIQAEKTVRDAYHELMQKLQRELGFGIVPPGVEAWIPAFLDNAQSQIDDALREAHAYIASADSPSPVQVHAHRRMVALHHEIIEVMSCGMKAAVRAFGGRALVMYGRG